MEEFLSSKYPDTFKRRYVRSYLISQFHHFSPFLPFASRMQFVALLVFRSLTNKSSRLFARFKVPNSLLCPLPSLRLGTRLSHVLTSMSKFLFRLTISSPGIRYRVNRLRCHLEAQALPLFVEQISQQGTV